MFNESDKNITQALLKYMHELAERDGYYKRGAQSPLYGSTIKWYEGYKPKFDLSTLH
jgi:hypothetical protein